MSKLRLLAVLLVAVLVGGTGWAQTQLAANITDVEVEQTGNGVTITLKADGLLQVMAFDQWRTNEDNEFELVLPNARSGIGTFVDLSGYPANYLKVETPSQERVERLVQLAGGSAGDLEHWQRVVQEGIGLILTVRLYRPGHIHTIEVDNVSWDGEWDWDPGEVAYDIRKARSGRAIEITIWSNRRERRRPDYQPRAKRDLDSHLMLDMDGDRITVDALNVPLQRLMSRVGEELGTNIYVDDRVDRLATLRLEDVVAADLVDAACTGLGLTRTLREGSWYISDGLPSSFAPYTESATRIIALDYIEAPEAIDLLPDFLLAYLRPSPGGDQIVAHGPTDLLDRVEADVAKLDRPARTVRIRMVVIETDRRQSARRVWHLLRGGSSTYEVDGAEGSIRFHHGEENIDDLVARIRALDGDENIRVDVRPWLTVQSGHAAEIFAGEQQYYEFIRRADDFDLRVTEAGTRLHVVPYAAGNEFIESRIRVDVATFRGKGRPPVVNRRTARSTMRLRSGDTMVIAGGLRLAQELDEDAGPGLLRPILPLRDVTESATEDEGIREIIFLLSAETVEERNSQDLSGDRMRGDA